MLFRSLEDVLSCEIWLDGIEKHNSREIGLYQIYLKDWFSKHTEGEPVSIDEFFNSEMQDEELKKYYLSLVNHKAKKEG